MMRTYRLARFLALPVSFSLSFSFASKILFAVPLLFSDEKGTMHQSFEIG